MIETNLIKEDIKENNKIKKIKKPKKEGYFNEKDISELVKEYQKCKSDKIFKKIIPSIEYMIEGMINKEFSYNFHVKNNIDEVKQICIMAILKSLEKFDPDKGRLFAYMNRIVKNNLLIYYYKSRKVKDKESNYTDFSKNTEYVMDDDNVLSYSNDKNESSLEMLEDSIIDSSPHYIYKLKMSDSIYIVYHYIKNLKENFDIYIDNKENFDSLLEDIKTNPFINFDFLKYYNNSIIKERLIYQRLIISISNNLGKVLKWLESTQSKSLKKEPDSYNGYLPSRSIAMIKNFVNTSLNRDNLTRNYNIDDLVMFIEYIMERNMKLAN